MEKGYSWSPMRRRVQWRLESLLAFFLLVDLVNSYEPIHLSSVWGTHARIFPGSEDKVLMVWKSSTPDYEMAIYNGNVLVKRFTKEEIANGNIVNSISAPYNPHTKQWFFSYLSGGCAKGYLIDEVDGRKSSSEFLISRTISPFSSICNVNGQTCDYSETLDKYVCLWSKNMGGSAGAYVGFDGETTEGSTENSLTWAREFLFVDDSLLWRPEIKAGAHSFSVTYANLDSDVNYMEFEYDNVPDMAMDPFSFSSQTSPIGNIPSYFLGNINSDQQGTVPILYLKEQDVFATCYYSESFRPSSITCAKWGLGTGNSEGPTIHTFPEQEDLLQKVVLASRHVHGPATGEEQATDSVVRLFWGLSVENSNEFYMASLQIESLDIHSPVERLLSDSGRIQTLTWDASVTESGELNLLQCQGIPEVEVLFFHVKSAADAEGTTSYSEESHGDDKENADEIDCFGEIKL